MSIVIFQSAKLGDISIIIRELLWANDLLAENILVDQVYGVSGGSITALAYALAKSAQISTERWGLANSAIDDFIDFFCAARSKEIRRLNINPWYGIRNLNPLRNWLEKLLDRYSNGKSKDILLTDLSCPLNFCSADRDGTFTMFGLEDPNLTFNYHAVKVGPPKDALLLDAFQAALSTALSTSPVKVNEDWYHDCRPAIVDAGAIVWDLYVAKNRSKEPDILRSKPFAPVRKWKQNWITSSFIMHSQNERNQTLLAEYYMDLQKRYSVLKLEFEKLIETTPPVPIKAYTSPTVTHVDLPYIGSTEAFTNMRQSVLNKSELMIEFRDLLQGQLDHFSFKGSANVIYGAGGFSGILAGLVTTREVDTGFAENGGKILQVYGVSAGVLNGFFHSIQIAAERHPDLYKPAATNALADLEKLISSISPRKIAKLNIKPSQFWLGWANLRPLEDFLIERLAAYTGSNNPSQITFDDIGLPMTVAAARLDGFTDFLGMSAGGRQWHFGGRDWRVISAPIIRSIIAGWSMNTYILPTRIGDQTYTDGGGTFYDPAIFVACMDAELQNLLNIHLDEPEGHSYNLPARPNLLNILFDTHNYYFPEERRRMRALTDLLYRYYQLRSQFLEYCSVKNQAIGANANLDDFRQSWEPNLMPAVAL
jgi:predicted acylesterase/phospholipase RssA